MRQVQNFIREQKMIMPGDFVIAGVSGGADSVCLFFELLAYQKEIPFSMEVVPIEHGIRGQDSLADANYVENLCKEYGVPFHLVSCNIKKMAQESSLTVEEAGRKARYQAFEQAAKKSGFVKKGEKVVLTGGTPTGKGGNSSLISIDVL